MPSGAIEPALSRFVDFYKEYSYLSGVKELGTNTPSSGEVIVFVPELGQSEDWITLSSRALNNILDFNFINTVNGKRFISNDVGNFNQNSDRSFTVTPEKSI